MIALIYAVLLAAAPDSITLTNYRIGTREDASETERYAAAELHKYLNRMTGAAFPLAAGARGPNTIWVGAGAGPDAMAEADYGFDGYLIEARPGAILVRGINDRGTLLGVYGLLERLGCRFFAPNFDFYGAAGGEFVPRREELRLAAGRHVVKPSMKYRKTDVAEGLTHTPATLKQIVEWMPKGGFNVLQAPIDHQGQGTAVWDKWRAALIPEARKRGILLEIGGHGYQLYLPQGKYFASHPEWFALRGGTRTEAPNFVFETSNPEAVKEFLANIGRYLDAHPEIDIFDLWPPDGCRWSESPESERLGSPTRRHALVVAGVAGMMREKYPRVKLQFLSYADYIFPAEDVKLSGNLNLDFCPFDRSFQANLFDWNSEINRRYVEALNAWIKGGTFQGDISVYTYYRKYIWRSLPVVIPRMIADETKRLHALGVRGMGLYSEPGDWFTYELNHYMQGRIAMDVSRDADQELRDYAAGRYGAAWKPVYEYFSLMERVLPGALAIPRTVVREVDALEAAVKQVQEAGALLKSAAALAPDAGVAGLVANLEVARRYAAADLELRLLAGRIFDGGNVRLGLWPQVTAALRRRRALFSENLGKGVFYRSKRTEYNELGQ